LDDLCSDGILLSNFKPTRDTSSERVASQFADFPHVRDFRAEETGAELLTKAEQALVRIPRDPLDREFQKLPNGICLRVWSPQLTGADRNIRLSATIEKARRYSTSPAPGPLIWVSPCPWRKAAAMKEFTRYPPIGASSPAPNTNCASGFKRLPGRTGSANFCFAPTRPDDRCRFDFHGVWGTNFFPNWAQMSCAT
jgi:hypothetical protein